MFVEPSVEEDDASVSDDASIDMADNSSDGEDDAVGEVDSSVDEDLSSDVAAEVEVEDSAISGDVSDVANVVVGGDSSVDDVKISGFAAVIKAEDFEQGHVIIKKGKKIFHKVVVE